MRRVWILISVLTGIFLLIAGNRIWNIRFLYLRAEARTDLVQIMKAANDTKGWSASDLNLRTITCPKKCTFFFIYKYRGSQIQNKSEKVQAWVENDQVRFVAYE